MSRPLPRNPRDGLPTNLTLPSSSAHVSRPPRSSSSIRPSQPAPSPISTTSTSFRSLPSGPRSALVTNRSLQPPSNTRSSASNHTVLASLDTPNRSVPPRARNAPFPNLPPSYTTPQTRTHSRASSSVSSGESELFEGGRGREGSDDGVSVWSGYEKGKGTRERVEEEDEVPPLPAIGASAVSLTSPRTSYYGNTLWSTLISSASSTAKAWQETFFARPDDYDELLTPEGETHVTAVLKSYYIDRAQTRDDLPEWLFGPRPTLTPSTAKTTTTPTTAQTAQITPTVTSPGPLRSAPLPTSRATDRLRQMREERRLKYLAVGGQRDGESEERSEGLAARPRSRRSGEVPRTADGRF